MGESHEILGGKVRVYRRENSGYWQCSSMLDGKRWRFSTKSDSLAHAKELAEDWYFRLRSGQNPRQFERDGDPAVRPGAKTFKEAADRFLKEFPIITAGQRNLDYVRSKEVDIRVHLNPFFGKKAVTEITAGLVSDYRMQRMQDIGKRGKLISRSTLHKEIVTLRQVLKTAHRQGWLPNLPDMTAPYKSSGKISHRAWFSPAEYKMLYEATRKRAEEPLKKRYKWTCEQLHDYVLFMANTGLRPDEANRLEYRDVTVAKDKGTGQTILEIEVRGKRGVGWCKSTPQAVHPFKRLLARNNPKPTDLLFPVSPSGLLTKVLDELGLKTDRDGNARTAYSLRHTYICFRLSEGADVWMIAKNCRTSVDMIEKFYAVHIKNALDASAINVRKNRISAKASTDKMTN
ncbi:hypothetical protein [Ancylobacter sp. FA202]|uniref:tyrosine-type recombinase/integrase n=1 Tax=Ancylobacter sp. FA202 TaxID=1111106 RepID=UPI00036EBAD3|nr:hypothetical protein [Ancylobacter sp. FA202]